MSRIKSTISALPLVFVILGVAMAIGGFKNFTIFMSGNVININEATVSDFDKEAMAEGNITFVYGPFAVLETSHKTYGITTSTSETNYYIVGNFDQKTYQKYFEDEEEVDMSYMILQVSDEALQKRLDSAAKEWISFLTYTGNSDMPPQVSINIKGMFIKTSDDVEFEEYYQDAREDLENVGISASQYAKMTLRNGELTAARAYGTFFGGIGLAVLGIVILIICIRIRKKNAAAQW